MIYEMYINYRIIKCAKMAVCGVNSGNFKSEWRCLFGCSHKDLVELHSQNKCIGVSSFVLQ